MTEQLPPYMDVFANKIYRVRSLSSVLDDDRVARVRCLFAGKKIISDLLHEITKNAHVLQIGLTFGPEISAVYEKVQKHGKLDIFDISGTQIELARKRYKRRKIKIINHDASVPWEEKYDVVICCNLLHELPPVTRGKVMVNALKSLTKGGKAVFIDCAKPVWWNPLRLPLQMFNRLYRPFSEDLWNNRAEDFCSLKNDFRWSHAYYRGHMFQKITAVRKILSNEDVLKLTKLFNESTDE